MRRLMLVLAVAALLVRGPAAFACSCVASDTRTHFKAATLVFVGTAMATETGPKGVQRVDLSITDLYKGKATQHVALETPLSAGACGIAFLPGQRYVVFARGAPGAIAKTSLCDGTTDDTYALAAAGYVRPIQRFGSGTTALSPVAHGSGARALVIALAGLLVFAGGGVLISKIVRRGRRSATDG